ncbi:hypothetical protein OfM2_18230 [Lactovum odontotermitis]
MLLNQRKKKKYSAQGCVYGLFFGLVLGLKFNNLTLWLGIGLTLGAAIGYSLNGKNKKD